MDEWLTSFCTVLLILRVLVMSSEAGRTFYVGKD